MLRDEFGVDAYPIKCDITSTEMVEAMVDEALAHFGRIDIVINNAGTGAVAPAEDITDEQFDNECNIDLKEHHRHHMGRGSRRLPRRLHRPQYRLRQCPSFCQ